MIDEEEEDVEKLLKRRISWKNMLKGILGLILLGGAFALITIAQQGGGINTLYLMFGILLMCMASSVMMPNRKKKKDLRHTISVLQCEKCGTKRVHDYKEGDFVYKQTNIPCEQCHTNYKIIEVYSLKLKSSAKIIKR
jgi:thiol:disulfide interchange protein